jgi:hypothetical protein
LPAEPPRAKVGRHRIDDRAALTCIIFVPMIGIPWEVLPTARSLILIPSGEYN